MNISIKVEGIKELQKELKRMTQRQIREAKQEVCDSAIEVQRKAKERLKDYGAWDTGNLANSIIITMLLGGKVAEIGPEAPYGPCIEFGTKPHFPPPDALEDWAKRHGFESTWPICKAIATHGIAARPYLLPAHVEVEPKFIKNLKRILEK